MSDGYIYAHKLNNRVFYIGLSFSNKNSQYRRAHDLSPRNRHHSHIVKKYHDDITIEILADKLDPGQCRMQEILAIRHFDTYHNGCNYTKGGDGISGYRFTEQQRRRNSDIQKALWSNKSTDQRQCENIKRSKAAKKSDKVQHHLKQLGISQRGTGNPMSGINAEHLMSKKDISVKRLRMSLAQKNRARSTYNTKRVQLINTGAVFDSVYEASKLLNINSANIRRSCASMGKLAAGKNSEGNRLLWRWI